MEDKIKTPDPAPKYPRNRPLKLHEILELCDDEDFDADEADICLFGNNGWLTDEDSGEEECVDPNRLNKNQLDAQAGLFITKGGEKEVRNQEQTSSMDAAEPCSSQAPTASVATTPESLKRKRVKTKLKKGGKAKGKKKKSAPSMWIDGDLENISDDFSHESSHQLNSDSHPIDFFLLFFDEALIKMIIAFIVNFAAQCNDALQLGVEEMFCFIGILFLSGYNELPRKGMYWEDSDDVRSVLVSRSMRRDRFDKIFKYLHFCSNDDLNPNDRFAKLRPLIEAMNERFLQYFPVKKFLSIDESMIPYFGRHGCKQFIKNKPVRFGFKAWVLALASGYCVAFTLYQGKGEYTQPGMGLGESVVMYFWNLLATAFPLFSFSFFADNFFTSPNLIERLTEKGFQLTGTVRANRTGGCPLPSIEQMKKRKRGTYYYKLNKRHRILACRWRDNNVVTVMSNQYGVNPVKKAQRYSREERKRVLVDQPDLIAQYNKKMGGVDLLDNNVANYRISMRGKKWYVPIFMWILDVAMSNAWILSRESGLKYDQLGFRREVVKTLLMNHGQAPSHPGRGSRKVSLPIRGGSGHLILPTKDRKRCLHCKSKTTKQCVKCGPMHDKCFIPFHNA